VTLLQRRLLSWYRRHGRAKLPWRSARSPYRTLISEFMLAQTQVDRVVPKFEAFIERFPDLPALAGATTAEVLRAWRGLGYNSRAVRLHRLARAVCERDGGGVPSDSAALLALPGVGAYTAAAIRAFAFNLDDVPVDTNVRRIVERVCFGLESSAGIAPSAVEAQARALLPSGRAHDWGSALMDLGATICTARAPKCLVCPLQNECKAAPLDGAALERMRAARNKARPPQAALPFERTTRYARGRIVERLRDLPPGQRISLLDLHREVAPAIPGRSLDDVRGLITALERDGLISHDGTTVALRE
jgi:A/G-specific adenine glycosylase